MTPELRKETSELQLHKLGIRINLQLHVIEADEEVMLRSAKELEHRIIALSLIRRLDQPAIETRNWDALEWLERQSLTTILSTQERNFLERVQSGQRLDDGSRPEHGALEFLAWSYRLTDKIEAKDLRVKVSRAPEDALLQFADTPHAFPQHCRLRPKAALMNWSDLLYRLHWSVRHAALNGLAVPGNLDAIRVQEWHRAVNWLCRYDDEDDWDHVSTETSA